MELKVATPKKSTISDQQMQSYCKKIETLFPNFYSNFQNYRCNLDCKAKAYTKAIQKANEQFYLQEISLFREQLTKLGKKYSKKCEQVETLKVKLQEKQEQNSRKIALNSEMQNIETLKKYHSIEKQRMIYQHERKLKENERNKQISISQLSQQYENTIEEMNKRQKVLNSQIMHLQSQIKEMESFIYEVSESEKSLQELSLLKGLKKQSVEIQKNEKESEQNCYKGCFQITSLKINIQNLKEENSMLRSYIEQQDGKLKKMERQQENSEQLKHFQKQMEKLSSVLRQQRLRVAQQHRVEQEKIRNINTRHQKALQQKNQQISQLNQKIHELKMQYDLKSSRIQQQYEIEVKKSSIFQQNLKEKLNLLESQEKQRESLRSSRKQDTHTHYKSIADSKSKEVQHLYYELSNFKNKQKKCYQQIEQLRQSKIDMSYENSRLQNTVDLLRSEVIDLQKKLKELQSQKNSNKQKSASKSQKKNLSGYDIEIIYEEAESLKESLRVSKGEHKFVEQELRNEIQRVQSQLMVLQTQNKRLQEEKQLILLNTQQKQAQKNQWEVQYKGLVEEFEEWREKASGEMEAVEDKLCKLEIQNCDMKTKEEIYELQRKTNIAHIKKLEQQQEKLIKLTIYIRELEESNTHAEQNSQKLQILERTLMQTKMVHAREISNYEIQISELNTSLESHHERIGCLQQELEESKKKFQQSCNRYDQLLHEKDQLLSYLKQNYENIMKNLEEVQHQKAQLLKNNEEQRKKHQQYQITTTRQKQKLKYFQMQIADLKQYILRITEEKQKLHEYIQNINDFFYGKCMEMSTYNKNLMESAQNFSFRKMKVEQFLAEKKIVEVEEGQLENLSEVITIPDFSEKKEVLQEEKIYGNNSESKSDRREEI